MHNSCSSAELYQSDHVSVSRSDIGPDLDNVTWLNRSRCASLRNVMQRLENASESSHHNLEGGSILFAASNCVGDDGHSFVESIEEVQSNDTSLLSRPLSPQSQTNTESRDQNVCIIPTVSAKILGEGGTDSTQAVTAVDARKLDKPEALTNIDTAFQKVASGGESLETTMATHGEKDVNIEGKDEILNQEESGFPVDGHFEETDTTSQQPTQAHVNDDEDATVDEFVQGSDDLDSSRRFLPSIDTGISVRIETAANLTDSKTDNKTIISGCSSELCEQCDDESVSLLEVIDSDSIDSENHVECKLFEAANTDTGHSL